MYAIKFVSLHVPGLIEVHTYSYIYVYSANNYYVYRYAETVVGSSTSLNGTILTLINAVHWLHRPHVVHLHSLTGLAKSCL